MIKPVGCTDRPGTVLPMANKITAAAERWALSLRSQGYAERTIINYIESVTLFDRWLAFHGADLPDIRRFHFDDWGAFLRTRNAESVRVLRLIAVRKFLRWAYEREIIDSDPTAGMTIRPAKATEVLIPSPEEWKAILTACKGRGFYQKRDRLVMLLLGRVGLRRQEIVNLTTNDVDLKQGVVNVVKSKGGKSRRATLAGEAFDAMDDYLIVRGRHRLAHTSQLILPMRGDQFTYAAVRSIVRTRCAQAGIEKGKYHPHSFRHLAASNLKGKVSDVYVLRQFGWNSVTMLRRYGAVVEADQAIAAIREVRFD